MFQRLFRNVRCAPRPRNFSTFQSRGPVSLLGLAVVGIAGGSVVVYYNVQKKKLAEKNYREVITVGKAALGGPWVLVDQDGVPRTDASYHGQFSLLYFGFTHCPDICPSELVKVGKVIDRLEKSGVKSVKALFVSVDPARDTIAQLRHYGQDFHKDFVFLTGTSDQIASAARAYRVYFSKANEGEDEEDYLVDHSIVFYLLSPTGEFLEFFTQRALVDDMVQKIKQLVEDYEPDGKNN